MAIVMDLTQKKSGILDQLISRAQTLTEITTGVTHIGNSAFRGCTQLATIRLTNATSIDALAFAYCKNGLNLYIYTNSVCALNNTTAFSNVENATIHVPAGLISQYKDAANWTDLYSDEAIDFVAL